MLWLLPLKRYFQFTGRAGRAEYWQFGAFYVIVLTVCAVIDESTTSPYQAKSYTLTTISFLLLITPLYAAMFRRMHDRNMSGWIFGIQVLAGFAAGFGRGAHDNLQGSIVGFPFLLIEYAGYLASAAIFFYIFWQFCLRGDEGTNRFGPPPTDTAETAPQLNEVISTFSEKARSFAPPPREADKLAQLERLAKLHQDGALTDEEFARQKAALLGT